MRLSDVDLRLLRVFKAVAQSGGFVKAQDILGISQPAISGHIANLESRLNASLCQRGPQGFSLTTEGALVLEETLRLLEHIDASAARLGKIGTIAKNQLRIGVVDCMITDPNNPMVSLIREFRGKRPDLKIKVGIYDYLEGLSELRAGRIDLALIGTAKGELMPADLDAMQLYVEESKLYCAPDHPCAKAQNKAELEIALRTSKIVAFSFSNTPFDSSFDVGLLDHSSDIAQDNIESTVYPTLAGTHVGLIPCHYAQIWESAGQLIPLDLPEHSITSQFHAVRLKASNRLSVEDQVWSGLQARQNAP